MPQTGYLCWCHLAQKLEFCKGKHQMVGVYNFVSNLLIYPEGVYPPLLSQCALFCRSLSFSIPLYPSSWLVHVHFCLLYFIALTPYIKSASHSHTLYHVLYMNEAYAWFTMFIQPESGSQRRLHSDCWSGTSTVKTDRSQVDDQTYFYYGSC